MVIMIRVCGGFIRFSSLLAGEAMKSKGRVSGSNCTKLCEYVLFD